MKFEFITCDKATIRREWISAPDYKMELSEYGKSLFGTCDEYRVNNAQDDCWDNDEVYQGDDGRYYCVVFDYGCRPAEPICWHELVRKEVLDT